MADMNKVWHFARTYMMSDRTNPPPTSFIDALRNLSLSPEEKNWLIGTCQSWPGGNPQVVSDTIKDIGRV